MSRESFSFVIYMLHACADRWGKSPAEVYRLLSSVNCIMGYLVPNYDVLHTQSSGFVAEDVKAYLKYRGVEI